MDYCHYDPSIIIIIIVLILIIIANTVLINVSEGHKQMRIWLVSHQLKNS